MKCERCKFWDVERRWGERKDKASCRVKAPSIRRGGTACDTTAEWPSTHANDWCGHFEEEMRTAK